MKKKVAVSILLFLCWLSIPAADDTKKAGFGFDVVGSMNIPVGLLYRGWGMGVGAGARIHFKLSHNIRGFLGGSIAPFSPLHFGTNTSVTLIVAGVKLASESKKSGPYVLGGIGLCVIPECHHSWNDSKGYHTTSYEKTIGIGLVGGGGYAYSLGKLLKVFCELTLNGNNSSSRTSGTTDNAEFAYFALNIGLSLLVK